MAIQHSLAKARELMTGRALAASIAASPTSAQITIALNGAAPQTITVPDQNVPLLYVLRNEQVFGLKGPKFGCGFGQCGACEIYFAGFGQSGRSCQATVARILTLLAYYGVPPAYLSTTPVAVLTLEGLGTAANPHPLQSAFIAQQAGQCAYCVNAMIMGALGFLHARYKAGNTNVPTTAEVMDFYSNSTYTDPTTGITTPSPYLCRCGAHLRFILAVQAATPATMTRFANGLI